MNTIAAKRDNARAEHHRQQRRADVEKYYHSLKSQVNSTLILPSLTEFRALPFVMHLQNKDAPNILSDLRSDGNSANSALKIDLNAWVTKHRAGFMKLLGYEGWRDPNPDILNPVDRITARFLCVHCGKVPMKLEERGAFDFTAACSHQCANWDKRTRRDHVFSPLDFTMDLKVSKLRLLAITSLLKVV